MTDRPRFGRQRSRDHGVGGGVRDRDALDEDALDEDALDEDALGEDVFDEDLLEGYAGDERPGDRPDEPPTQVDVLLGVADLDRHPAPRARALSRRKSARTARRLLVLLVTLALVTGAGYLAVDFLRPLVSQLRAPNDYPGPGSGSVTVTVEPGDTGRSIGATLETADVVKSAKAFSDAAADNPAAAGIQPGSYEMRRQMRAGDALALLVDSRNRTVPRVTVREGLWASEVLAELSSATGIPAAAYAAAARDGAALGLPPSANGNIEGYLFPDTYEFPARSRAADQLRLMVQRSVSELTRLRIDPASMERVIIVASIVEAEGRRAEDRPRVARVIENRLARKPTPMRLQMDSTVSYAVKRRAITTTDVERATPSPYNTYQVDGLPAGPISNPGASAMAAAAAPEDGPWLYFVTVDPSTGETKFAVTEDQHRANVAQFQKWCSDHKGQC